MTSYSVHLVHATQTDPPVDRISNVCCHSWEQPLEWRRGQTPISDALDQVGPRLRRIRDRPRRHPRPSCPSATGISKSTLSRLENGQRRPSLELLLPLAQAHRVPLDDLVGAPEVGDPRIRLKPRRVNGRTVVPLTKQPGAVQAWKIVIPAAQSKPRPRVHDGYEWLYVLVGRMRLVLGDQDMVLERRRGGGVRHDAPPLVRQHRPGPGGGPEHLRPARRADARAGEPGPALNHHIV